MTGTDGISSLGKLLGSLSGNDTKTARAEASSVAQPTSTLDPASAGRLTQDHSSVSVAAGLAAQAAGGSDVRLAKVAQLQQAIASGTYNVSSSAVADKIVEGLLNGR